MRLKNAAGQADANFKLINPKYKISFGDIKKSKVAKKTID